MSRRNRFEATTRITSPLENVFEFFSDPANLGRITPPSMRFRIIEAPARRLQEGDRIDYSIRVFGLPMRWRTRIVMWREGEAFADLQERGPYRLWIHTHTFHRDGEGVLMRDVVEYELPLGWVGRLFGGRLVARQIEGIFSYRAEAIERVFGAA
ncbi:MAG TPA: SRPBCC family protein [Thermoanaerobaculia bacterium]